MGPMGAYRRRIELVTVSPSVVEGELVDDFPHFRVSIAHADGRVTAVEGGSPRHPWSTCRDAIGPLRALVGVPVTPDATAHGAHLDARTTCTHWFDLAGLAIAQAGSGREHRRYDVVVPDRDEAGATTAQVDRDGAPVMTWEMRGQAVLRPKPFADRDLGRGFLAWANATLDPDTAEAAIILRRAMRISMGRLMDLDVYDRASEIGHGMAGTCHTFTPGVAEVALRMKGSTRTD